jgi:protein SCO1/2
MRFVYFLIGFLCLNACSSEVKKLPILGEREAISKIVDGKEVIDTLYATVPPFSFINQEGDTVTQALVQHKIYVADFFFVSCPTICPIMKREMLRVYQAFKGDTSLYLLSHTIDPQHDTIALLKQFATDLGVEGKQWQFLTGQREKIYEMAEKGYYATALPDSTEPGGFVHSGGFILVDRQGRVRGIYDGIDAQKVDELIADIALLKKE